MSTQITIGMPFYKGVTQLDFTGPDQFLVNMPEMEVIVASMTGKPRFCFADLRLAIWSSVLRAISSTSYVF